MAVQSRKLHITLIKEINTGLTRKTF